MKYAMKHFAGLILPLAMLALACMVVQPASAATLTHNFKDDNGKNFSAKGAYSIDTNTPGQVKVVKPNGTAYTFADSTGALATKLLNYMAAGGAGAGNFYTIPGTGTHMGVTETTEITCYGTGTMFGYPLGGYSKFINDGCAARNAINGMSN